MRPLDEQDFYEICEKEGVSVVEMEVPTSFYMYSSGEHVIVLRRSEHGLRRLFSAYHELGHYFLHGGDVPIALFRGSREKKMEVEADAFAAIALCPETSLRNFRWLDEHGDHFAARVWLIRNRIFETYRI